MQCSCEVCTSACSYNPGWFLPGEVERLAEFLECSVQEVFDVFLCANYWIEDEGQTYVLAPLTTEDQHRAGGKASFSKRGDCIFLHEGLCQIHEVKPHECAWFDHRRSTSESANKHEFIKEMWKNQQDQIKQLLNGKE